MTRKALLISHKYPFPADDGKKTVLAGFAAYLLDRYGMDNFIYVVIGNASNQLDEARSGRTVFIRPPGRLEQIWNLLTLLFRNDSQSLQEALTWSAATGRALQSLLDEVKPELVILDTIRIGQYFSSSTARSYRRVLYMDDLFYLRFERLLKIADSGEGQALDAAGTFAAQLPVFARALLRLKPVQTFLYRFEMSRIKLREADSVAHFKRCLLINPNEARTLASLTGAANVFAIRPLLNFDTAVARRNYAGTPDFLIFGSLRHPIHRASVIHFLETCMDEIRRSMPAARIQIVGSGADDTIKQLVARYPDNIVLHGFVDDPVPLFASSCALLVPMLAAGGLKLKTLTALYHGLPVISTRHGIDGIELRSDVDCLLENNLERFPARMQQLCDLGLNREISENARESFLKYYSRDGVFSEYDRLFA